MGVKNLKLNFGWKLKNKVAIVTGSASGIGKAIAISLGEKGVKVIVADIEYKKAVAVVRQIKKYNTESIPVVTDVSNLDDLQRLVKMVISKYNRIDILINNAGICPRTIFEKITEEEWNKVLDVNLKSAFFLSREVFTYMKKEKYGRIINIASSAGKMGGVQVGVHYAVSKAGLICLTKSLALQGASFGINVNAVCPGIIDTPITSILSPEKIVKYKQLIPIGKIGSPIDVANAVLFLVSDYASYITGEIMDVNGGFIMD